MTDESSRNSVTVVELLQQYEGKSRVYASFAQCLSGLIETVLRDENLVVHSVTSRGKDVLSLRGKLQDREPPYQTLTDITDLSGVRITTYFADDVDAVGRLIEREFDVDQQNSVDKRATHDPDRFGYLSLHYVASLTQTRAALTEYRAYSGLKCEVQVRSVLQHAWAEIEHDLGYKTKGQIPYRVRRRFARIAGLLELADIEFADIRRELVAYADEVPQLIRQEPSSVLLDAVSIESFIALDPLVLELDRHITSLLGGSLIDGTRPELIEPFLGFGITTVEEIGNLLRTKSDAVKRFARRYIGDRRGGGHNIRRGISLFYLRYLMIAEHGDVDFGIKALPDLSEDVAGTVRRIIEVYNKV
jgi:putative GTP pyrophosphokinase